MHEYDRSVFLNVPFDRRYKKLMDALIFAVLDCGLIPRCALEVEDGAQVRIDKLFQIIGQCRYGIHDLSRTTLDRQYRLPRFNMPLELGIFLGARRFGSGRQKSKKCLILDRDQYRFQKYCSDISGQDIRPHGNEVVNALTAVRNWLQTSPPQSAALPGPSALQSRYLSFRQELPRMCTEASLEPGGLTFLDYRQLAETWIEVTV